MNPKTLQVIALGKKGGALDGFKVIESNFSYDLASNNKLLSKFVGRDVLLTEENEFQDRTKETKAKLLRVNGQRVFLIDGELHLNHPGRIVLPDTKDLSLTPALSLGYILPRSTVADLTAVYMAGGISWSADYLLTLDDSGSSAALTGWITVRNASGVDFKDAGVSVVAGDVNRVQGNLYALDEADSFSPMSLRESKVSYEPEVTGVFEYFLIKIPGEKTIPSGESRHFTYMTSTITGVTKEYTVRNSANYRRGYTGGTDGETKLPVEVSVSFKNTKENNAGSPLPGGIMRIYHKKGKEAPFFIGEEHIKNIPKGEEVKVTTGNAFDITAKHTVTDFKRIRANLYEEAASLTIKSSKKEPVTVTVKSTLRGSWEVLESSIPYKKLNASTIGFDVTLPPGGETTLKYRYSIEE